MKTVCCFLLGISLAFASGEEPDKNKPVTKKLFDGKSLAGWAVTDFAGGGEVEVIADFKGKEPAIILNSGYMTGIHYTNAMPKKDYEITLEAMRVEGSDFFCGITFPVQDMFCSFIVGGWGGGVTGISSINGSDASQNDTTKYMPYENGRWYKIRVKVSSEKVEAWIDDEKMAEVPLDGNTLSTRIEMETSKPFGIATWNTKGALRNIQLKEWKGSTTPAAK